MKKIFTILLAAGSITFASAQSASHNGSRDNNDKGNSRDVILGQSNSSSVYKNNTADYGSNSYGRDSDEQIQKINREFGWKIAEVKRNRHMKPYEKSRQIKMLEKQRDQQIREVQMRFENSRNRHQDSRYDNHKW